MNWIKSLILFLFTFTACIGILYVADLVGKKSFGLGEPVVYDSHPLWGYSPRKNKTYTRFDGDKITINEVGLRSTNKWNKNGKNILFLGDSVTYGGSYINDDQTFSFLACKELKNWRCHNGGVNAYGIMNMVAKSRYDDRISSAPIRVFTFISGDFDRGLQKFDTAHFILREPPSHLSAIWEVLNFISARIIPKEWFGKNSDLIENNAQYIKKQKINRQFALDIFFDELNRLESKGLDFLVVFSPSIEEIENAKLILNNKIIFKIKNKYPNRFIDLTDTLTKAYYSDEKLIFKDQVHYWEKGHLLVSKTISPFLKEIINRRL